MMDVSVYVEDGAMLLAICSRLSLPRPSTAWGGAQGATRSEDDYPQDKGCLDDCVNPAGAKPDAGKAHVSGLSQTQAVQLGEIGRSDDAEERNLTSKLRVDGDVAQDYVPFRSGHVYKRELPSGLSVTPALEAASTRDGAFRHCVKTCRFEGISGPVRSLPPNVRYVDQHLLSDAGAQEQGLEHESSSRHGLSFGKHVDTIGTTANRSIISMKFVPAKRIRYSHGELLRLRPPCTECPPCLYGLAICKRRHEPKTTKTFEGWSDVGNACSRTMDVQGSDPEQFVSFGDLGLPAPLHDGLRRSGFVTPSPVQVRGIPLGRMGVDLVAQAKSGTGKTIVFCVIALELVLRVRQESNRMSAMIIAPTRDIAAQVQTVLEGLSTEFDPRPPVGLFIGGAPLHADENEIRRQMPSIGVGTPGRLEDLIRRGVLDVTALKLLVLDEADRLLDSPLGESVSVICSLLPARKQVAAFSATYSFKLFGHLKSVMRDPQFVNLYCDEKAKSMRDQKTDDVLVEPAEVELVRVSNYRHESTSSWRGAVLRGVRQAKMQVPVRLYSNSRAEGMECKAKYLRSLLNAQPFGQAVVFTNNRLGGMLVKDRLRSWGFATVYTSGQERQSARRSSMNAMRSGLARVLVSTDLVARGVDLPGCDLVVHLDIPLDTVTYLHRVGRAGRFGSRGVSVLLYGLDGEERGVEHLERELAMEFEDAFELTTSEVNNPQGGLGTSGVFVARDGANKSLLPNIVERELPAPIVNEGGLYRETEVLQGSDRTESVVNKCAVENLAARVPVPGGNEEPDTGVQVMALSGPAAGKEADFDRQRHSQAAYEAGVSEGYIFAVQFVRALRARLGSGALRVAVRTQKVSKSL